MGGEQSSPFILTPMRDIIEDAYHKVMRRKKNHPAKFLLLRRYLKLKYHIGFTTQSYSQRVKLWLQREQTT